MKNKILISILVFGALTANSQSMLQQYTEFKTQKTSDVQMFRDECNNRYAEFLRTAWERYESREPVSRPVDDNPVPPMPYVEDDHADTLQIDIDSVVTVTVAQQPVPVVPIREMPGVDDDGFCFTFYGVTGQVRLPERLKTLATDVSPDAISQGWRALCGDDMNNAIRDCLEARIRYNLCDWAYLEFLTVLGKSFCSDGNSATLLTAFLYCQSGYQMRLAVDGDVLVMLFGCRQTIYGRRYYEFGGVKFFANRELSGRTNICNVKYEGETPMSLLIGSEQLLGNTMSETREICSKRYPELRVMSSVPEELIAFYNNYPDAGADDTPVYRWVMYAHAPLSDRVKTIVYPQLENMIGSIDKKEAAERLLNWVQTGFEYGFDEKIWGRDRAFFAEETLYYPYCDCEDRSILFTHLIRDLLGLDVALVYWPGHVAAAVAFEQDVRGDAVVIGGRRFVICDPTYVGAPVGSQMPNLDGSRVEAMIAR